MNNSYLETIRVVDGEFYHLTFHQQRLERTLGSVNSHNLKNILVNPPKKGVYRCRVLYDAFELKVEYIPYVKPQINSLKLIVNDTIEYAKKYAHREPLNTLFALRGECDDILIVKGGLITDTSIANIALYDGRRWLTPKRVLLEGTTRARYIKQKKIVPEDIFVSDINHFSKIALMNAMVDFDIIAKENIEDIIC